jgi:glutamine cyclotransferase
MKAPDRKLSAIRAKAWAASLWAASLWASAWLTHFPHAVAAPELGPVCYGYRVIHAYPHDPQAFTQGLVYADGSLYESTGLLGRSELRQVDLATGAVLKRRRLPDAVFGEGLSGWNDRLIQLTWRSHIGFVYERASFRLLKSFRYPTEGWGMTHDDRNLIMSDGSSTLRLLDPQSFEPVGELPVRDGSRPVSKLNELEYVRGEIYANVWLTALIARISPRTGQVTGWVDLGGLLSAEDSRGADVLNGIAYDPEGDRLFVTGKLWPKLFEIELSPSPCGSR